MAHRMQSRVGGRFTLPQPRPRALSQGLGVRTPPCTSGIQTQAVYRSSPLPSPGHLEGLGGSPAPLPWCTHVHTTLCVQFLGIRGPPAAHREGPPRNLLFSSFLHLVKRERVDVICSLGLLCRERVSGKHAGSGAQRNRPSVDASLLPNQVGSTEHPATYLRLYRAQVLKLIISELR